MASASPRSRSGRARPNLTYTCPLFGGEVTARGEVVYRSSYIYRIFNNSALDKVPQYDIFNLYLAYHPGGQQVTYSLSATNLFDRDGVNSRFTDPYGEQTTSQEFIAPRQGVRQRAVQVLIWSVPGLESGWGLDGRPFEAGVGQSWPSLG